MAIAKSLEAQTKGLRQAVRNSNDGISLIQVAEGGMNEISNILVRLRELTIQASSDTVGEKERGFLDLEYGQLVEEVDRIAQSTKFNGTSLLNGDSGKGVMEFQVGTYAEEINRIKFDSDATNVSSDSLSIEGSSISDKDDALDVMSTIDEAISNVAGQRAVLGSIQSRLQSTTANLETQALNQENARSVIEDVDVAEASSRIASTNVIKQAGIASLAQANYIPNSALKLIG